MASKDSRRVEYDKLVAHAAKVLRSLGVPEGDAWTTGRLLTAADLRGVDSHGVVSLVPFYAKGIREGRINPRADIKVVTRSAAAAVVDGDRGLGFVVGDRAMREAMGLAEAAGVGAVTVRNSTHFGAAFVYTMIALERDMIGIAMTNPNPEVIPPGAAKPGVGTNPIAVAVPAGRYAPFVLDMATSVVASGKLRKAQLEGRGIPPGWAIDKGGEPITDPAKRSSGEGGLLPLGGTPELGAWKGFGLGVLVEILCGVLSGASASILRNVPIASDHFFAALRIGSFLPVEKFKDSMDRMIDSLKALPRLPGVDRVTLAGELEAEIAQDRRANGVPLHPKTLREIEELSKELGIDCDL